MGNEDKIPKLPSHRVVRSPEDVQGLKTEEERLRDPQMQHARIPTILQTISQMTWFKNVEQMEKLRESLPKTQEQLGILIAGSAEQDWKNNPLYYWVLCSAYMDAMREERIRLSDDPGDSDPPESERM